MTVLKDISVLWTMLHTLVMFLFLFESRYPRKKILLLTAYTMVPLIVLNLVLFVFMGLERYGTLMLATLSLPSCLVFWFFARHRDGRFFFTFCMVDTVVLEILYITNLLNHYLTPDSYWVMFGVRLVSLPLLELLIYKKLRPMYLEVQHHVQKGWGIFAVIGALFYLAITLVMTYPTPVTDRPHQLPLLVLLFLLMPVIYLFIISTLRRQQVLHDMAAQEQILSLQVSNLTTRMEELNAADEKFRVERHNFRHKLSTLTSLLETEQYDQCLSLLSEYKADLDKTKALRYCQHPVLDAVLSAYAGKAKEREIRLTLALDFPETLPVREPELATVIANGLENAFNACEKLPGERRFLEIRVVHRPRFMIRIRNSAPGKVALDEEGIPLGSAPDHGIGTRFIAAFCSKNGGFCEFESEEDTFTLHLNF